MVKNALDSLEGLKDDPRPYFDGRAVGCIVSAGGAQASGSTLAALRSIIHALRGWPTPFGATLEASGLFDDAGAFADPRDLWQVETVAQQVVEFACRWMAKRASPSALSSPLGGTASAKPGWGQRLGETFAVSALPPPLFGSPSP